MGDAAHQFHAQLLQRPFPLGEHAVQHDGAVRRLRRADRVLGQLEEVLGDLGRAAHFAVQHHQRARALRIERAPVQQVREGPDGRQAIVQRVEDIGRALVQHHVPDLGGPEPRGRWRRHDRRDGSRGARRASAADERPDEDADQRAESERDPQSHGAPI